MIRGLQESIIPKDLQVYFSKYICVLCIALFSMKCHKIHWEREKRKSTRAYLIQGQLTIWMHAQCDSTSTNDLLNTGAAATATVVCTLDWNGLFVYMSKAKIWSNANSNRAPTVCVCDYLSKVRNFFLFTETFAIAKAQQTYCFTKTAYFSLRGKHS